MEKGHDYGTLDLPGNFFYRFCNWLAKRPFGILLRLLQAFTALTAD
jgi:hypothetical protein